VNLVIAIQKEGKDGEGVVTRLTHWTTKKCELTLVMLWLPGCIKKGTFSKWQGSHFLTCHARRLVSFQARVHLLVENGLVNIGQRSFGLFPKKSVKDQKDFKTSS